KFAAHVKSQKITTILDLAQLGFKQTALNDARLQALKQSADEQWRLAGEFLALARLLRPVPDKLSAMRDARQRLVKAIEEETALKADVGNPPKRGGGGLNNDDKTKPQPNRGLRLQLGKGDNPRILMLKGVNRGGNEAPVDPALAWGKEVGDRQGWLEHYTRGIRGNLGVHLPQLAEK